MNIRFTISKKSIEDWIIIAYMANEAIQAILNFVLSRFGMTFLTSYFTVFLFFFPYFLLVIRERRLIGDEYRFFVLYFLVLFFFCITYFFHPEYDQYFYRGPGNYLNVWNAVFSPISGGLVGFFFFSMHKDPIRIKRILRCAAYVFLVYGIYHAVSKQEWTAIDMHGQVVKQDYALNFGYELVFFAMILIYCFLENRKQWFDLAAGVFMCFLSFLKGSRGSMLCLAVFVVLYVILFIQEMKILKKILIICAIIIVSILVNAMWEIFYTWLIAFITSTGTSSRFLSMLVEGTLTSDSGRSAIYQIAFDGIAEQSIWGLGAYGSRYVIAPYYYWGYPHNIFLEFVMEFGWIAGVSLSFILVLAIFVSFKNANRTVKGLLCIFVSINVKLLISDSFWQFPHFWELLALIFVFSKHKHERMKSKHAIFVRNRRSA